MTGGKRPVGRVKRVGTGGGNATRRGGGLDSGPVGNPRGYSERRGTSSAPQPRSFGGAPANRSAGGMPTIMILLVIGFIAMRFLGGIFTGDAPPPPGGPSVTDPGAYPVVTSVSALARDKRIIPVGGGDDVVTVMVYMCASDLESQSGLATADLQEMLYAEISGKVNIIVETGGAMRWQNTVISSTSNQRYRVTNEGLVLLQDNLGRKSMVDPHTLSDFIRYAKANHPADRYMLILWDHGGGSLGGYGHDEFYPKNSMDLGEIARALEMGGCTFDWIGFDACLMGTFETAIVLEPFADYMIASEELEPGIGWDYTGWITALSRNTSIATVDLGKILIDDYIADVKAKTPRSQATLSLIDLAEFKGTVPQAFVAFAETTTGLIDTNQFKKVSDARAGSKEFARSSQINQIDLVHFAEKLNTPESQAFADVLRGAVKYNRMTNNISDANGLSIYFPYSRLPTLNTMLATYKEIGIDPAYSECLRSFASLSAGGQIVSAGGGNLLDVLLGGTQGGEPSGGSGSSALEVLLNTFLAGGDYSSITGLVGNALGWLDIGRIRSSLDYYADNMITAGDLVVTVKDGQRVLALPEEKWDLVQYMELNVFLDDGEGFIDLGLDNVYEYNSAGDLIMEYDGTWLALNGQIVSYYMISDDRTAEGYSIRGRVPALLNNQRVDIIIVFDDHNPYGVVLGAQIVYDLDAETVTLAKGLLDIVRGDAIDFLCDYYTYDGVYTDSFFLGDRMVASGQWRIENLSVGGYGYQMTYRVTDIYNNQIWTPSIRD
jgi:hypothetical protein